MKLISLLIVLAIAGTTGITYAQIRTVPAYPATTKADQLYNLFPDEYYRHHFTIVHKNGNIVRVLLFDKTGLDFVMNLDSLLAVVANNLDPLQDSLQHELNSKRIDYLDAGEPVKIRITQTPSRGANYALLPDGPSLMKVEQDTLIFTSYKLQPSVTSYKLNFSVKPFRVIVLINDIRNLHELIDGSLNKGMQQVKKEWDALRRWSPENNWKTNLSSYYSTTNPEFNQSIKEPYSSEKVIFNVYVQLSLQNLNNRFVTGAGAGFQIINKIKNTIRNRYQLFWEPYFLFDEDPTGKFKMRRNDFITFQVLFESHFTNANQQKIEFSQNFSGGYLVHRSGEFFRKNTFKFGLPGARYKDLYLHPECVFNDLFKNFQPGLKLFLDLD
jgi:hypothetical protein